MDHWPDSGPDGGEIPMKLNVEDLQERELELSFEVPPESFPSLDEISAEGSCRFIDPVFISLHARRVREMIVVDGRFQTRVRFMCSRCLAEFEDALSGNFTLTYTRRSDPEEPPSELELEAEEIGIVPFEGNEIDLRDGIQEEIVMSIPMQPHCSEDCRGLCPQCGADLNLGSCGCQTVKGHPKFAVLKGLKLKK
jgi:uncharacterized protein